jgi:hypothetical protein
LASLQTDSRETLYAILKKNRKKEEPQMTRIGEIIEVLFEIPHLKLVNLEGHKLCLIVEDTEVNDFVEDFLLENKIEIENVEIEENQRIEIYLNYFIESLSTEKIIQTLKKIDSKEISEIFRINNK